MRSNHRSLQLLLGETKPVYWWYEKEWPVNGYCSICIWFPAGRGAEIRTESENTCRGSAGSEATTHTAERRKKAMGTYVKKWIE